ncbi:DnaB-like helicase C-terminal domain-containing protein [Candidatus Vidania fulgoroideorum]
MKVNNILSIESEKAVLSCLMKNTKYAKNTINILEEDDFKCKENLIVFLTLKKLIIKGKKIDIPLITEKIRKRKENKTIGIKYLIDIYNYNCFESNLPKYIRIIKRYRYIKSMLINLKSINNSIKTGEIKKGLIYSKLMKCIVNIRKISKKTSKDIKEQVGNIYKYILNKRKPVIYKTGFYKLDKILSGILPGELIIVAGRPATGKTSFCINILNYNSIKKKNTVFFFSLEMSATQLIIKLIGLIAKIDTRIINNKGLNKKEINKVIKILKIIRNSNIYIYDSIFTSTLDIYNYVIKRIIPKERNIIIIDYIQLIKITSTYGNRSIDISEVSSYLKSISKELNIPIIIISQLNRQVEQRVNKTPILSDLRESGSLEQDADKIIFLSKDYFNTSNNNKEKIKIVIGKNRNGPTGTIELNFIKNHNKFVDV